MKINFRSYQFRIEATPMTELLLILLTAISIYLLSGHYDWFEQLVDFAHQHESWEIDEILVITFYLSVTLGIFAFRRWRHQLRTEQALHAQVARLNRSINEVRQLRGILPICAACKKIRDDQGYWHQVESYVRDHSDADFSHGICPTCIQELYPGYARREKVQPT